MTALAGGGSGKRRSGGVGHTPACQLEDEPGEVDLGDLRLGVGLAGAVLDLRPEAVGDAGLGPPGSPGPLVGRGTGDGNRAEAGHPGVGVETRRPGEARVDDDPHPFDGEARLGDVGGEDDLAPCRREEGGVLGLGGEAPVEEVDVGVDPGEETLDPTHLSHSGEEDEDVAGLLGERPADDPGDVVLGTALTGGGNPADVDGEGTGLAGDDRSLDAVVPEELGDPRGVDRCRHGEDGEVGSHRSGDVEGEGEPEVGLQVALVDLVEDDEGGSGKGRVGLEPAGEHPFGDDLDAGARPPLPVVAGDVADGLAHRLPEEEGHPPGGGAGGETPRLEDDDLPRDPGEEPEGDDRCLSGTGRGDEDCTPPGGESGDELGDDVLDGKIGHGPRA